MGGEQHKKERSPRDGLSVSAIFGPMPRNKQPRTAVTYNNMSDAHGPGAAQGSALSSFPHVSQPPAASPRHVLMTLTRKHEHMQCPWKRGLRTVTPSFY